MSKRRVRTTSEIEPEPVDFDAPAMSPHMRMFANELQGLKNLCIDNEVSFEDATDWYQAWMSDTAHGRATPLDGVRATRSHVEAVIASVKLLEASATASGKTFSATTANLQAETEMYLGDVRGMGFPKERALEILAEAAVRSGEKIEDAFKIARAAVAAEMYKVVNEEVARSEKLTIGIAPNGKPKLVYGYQIESHRERIRRLYNL